MITCTLTLIGQKPSATKSRKSATQHSTLTQRATMSASIPQRCARQLLREASQRSSLPIFLAPAFSPRAFSTTSPAQSRVGGAAISIPPEVSFKLVDLPKSLVRTRGKDIPKYAAEIKGPRGMYRSWMKGIEWILIVLICRRDVPEHSLIPYCYSR